MSGLGTILGGPVVARRSRRVAAYLIGCVAALILAGCAHEITVSVSDDIVILRSAGDDLVVGAPSETENLEGEGSRIGAAYVFRGLGSTFVIASAPPAILSAARQRLSRFGPTPASSANVFGWSSVLADFNEDGWTDLVVGVPGAGQSNVESGGRDTQRPGVLDLFVGSADGFVPHSVVTKGREPGGLPGVFGNALATGDFNGDGHIDLAGGSPGHPLTGQNSTTASGAVFYYLRRVPLPDNPDAPVLGPRFGRQLNAATFSGDLGVDGFGWSLAAGDFDGDGVSDLSVGAPRRTIAGASNSGAVFVFKGGQSGLEPSGQLDQTGLGQNEAEDRFGQALAVGDFDGDTFDDLAVGAIGEAPGSDPQSGYVFVYRGGDQGLVADRGLDQASMSPNEAGDMFGFALTAGDFNGDGFADLAVGAIGGKFFPSELPDLPKLRCEFAPGRPPLEDIDPGAPTVPDRDDLRDWRDCQRLLPGTDSNRVRVRLPKRTGRVFIFNGSSSGLAAAVSLGAGIPWPPDGPTGGEEIGYALSSADYNGDGFDDLAVAATGKAAVGDYSAVSGTVLVFKGSASGLVFVQELDQRPIDDNEPGDLFGIGLSQ